MTTLGWSLSTQEATTTGFAGADKGGRSCRTSLSWCGHISMNRPKYVVMNGARIYRDRIRGKG